MRNKFDKIIERNADNEIDSINNRLADLGRVSYYVKNIQEWHLYNVKI